MALGDMVMALGHVGVAHEYVMYHGYVVSLGDVVIAHKYVMAHEDVISRGMRWLLEIW